MIRGGSPSPSEGSDPPGQKVIQGSSWGRPDWQIEDVGSLSSRSKQGLCQRQRQFKSEEYMARQCMTCSGDAGAWCCWFCMVTVHGSHSSFESPSKDILGKLFCSHAHEKT